MTAHPHALPSILKTPSMIILADLVLFARRGDFGNPSVKVLQNASYEQMPMLYSPADS